MVNPVGRSTSHGETVGAGGEADERADDSDAALATVLSDRGTIPNVFRAMSASPGLLEAVAPIGTFFRESSVLPPHVREAIVVAVAFDTESTYEWCHHARIARRLALDPVRIALDGPWVPGDELIRAGVTVGRACLSKKPIDADAAALLAEQLGPRAVVEATGIAGYYAMLAALVVAWEVPLDSGVPVEPMPARSS